jgi:hypothetical protein
MQYLNNRTRHGQNLSSISDEAELFAQYFFENWTTGPDSWRGGSRTRRQQKGVGLFINSLQGGKNLSFSIMGAQRSSLLVENERICIIYALKTFKLLMLLWRHFEEVEYNGSRLSLARTGLRIIKNIFT